MPDYSGDPLPFLRWSDQPDVDAPVLLVAFGGWNDAGDSATTAVEFMAERWNAKAFADIDPEVFYDFTTVRPEVRIDFDGNRRIDWPTNIFRAANTPPSGKGIITLTGIEPQLRWRTDSATRFNTPAGRWNEQLWPALTDAVRPARRHWPARGTSGCAKCSAQKRTQ